MLERKCSAKKPGQHDDPEKFFCKTMWQVMSEERTAGLSPLIITNFKTRTASWAGLVLRAKRTDKGIVINYCPFCGVSLRQWLAPHIKKEAERKRIKVWDD